MAELNDREKQILRAIIRQFIVTAGPVGSSQISADPGIGLKSASVRRVMASLEEKGYVQQPHTSAGRVPTTAGYRFYVDQLIQMETVGFNEIGLIYDTIETYDGDVHFLMNRIAGLLAATSNQLGIVVTPRFYESTFERMQILQISGKKLMIILSVRDGQTKTMIMEVRQRFNPAALRRVIQKINQRFHGKSLREIKDSFAGVMRDLQSEETGLIRLFSETADRLFDFDRYESFALNGTSNILNQPEFSDINRFSTLIRLLENKKIVIHFMEKREFPPGIKITIGNEHDVENIKNCSVITSTYRVGDGLGVVGIIGPMRMKYSRVIPLVDFTATALTQRLGVA